MDRQVDVLTAQGKPVADVVPAIGMIEVTYYRWRNGYSCLKGDQVIRLKELEADIKYARSNNQRR